MTIVASQSSIKNYLEIWRALTRRPLVTDLKVETAHDSSIPIRPGKHKCDCSIVVLAIFVGDLANFFDSRKL